MICLVIRCFDPNFQETPSLCVGSQLASQLPWKMVLPESRCRYTVLRSPHIDKKSREQFEMLINTECRGIPTTERNNDWRKLFSWLKCRATRGTTVIEISKQPILDYLDCFRTPGQSAHRKRWEQWASERARWCNFDEPLSPDGK